MFPVAFARPRIGLLALAGGSSRAPVGPQFRGLSHYTGVFGYSLTMGSRSLVGMMSVVVQLAVFTDMLSDF